MNPRTIRRAAERAARKSDVKAQRLQTYTAAPETTQSKTVAPVQFAANQANPQLSTGPASLEGTAMAAKQSSTGRPASKSSRNHTIHGLTAVVGTDHFAVLPGENQAAYDAALAAYKLEWKPTTASELDLVQRLATHAWLRDRALRLQDAHLHLGLVEMKDYKQFEIYGRYYTTHLRAYNKAFADLLRLRSFQMRQRKDEALLQRRAQDVVIRFESQRRKTEEHTAKMETVRLKQEAQKQRNLTVKATTAVVTQSA